MESKKYVCRTAWTNEICTILIKSQSNLNRGAIARTIISIFYIVWNYYRWISKSSWRQLYVELNGVQSSDIRKKPITKNQFVKDLGNNFETRVADPVFWVKWDPDPITRIQNLSVFTFKVKDCYVDLYEWKLWHADILLHSLKFF